MNFKQNHFWCIFWKVMTFTTLILQNLEGIENYYPFFIKCSWQSFPERQCVYRHFFFGSIGKYHPQFFGIELQYLPQRFALRKVLQLNSSKFWMVFSNTPSKKRSVFSQYSLKKKGRYSHIVIQKMIADSEGSWNITVQILLIKWNFSIKFVR